jgi:hypothetical protein
MQDPDPGSGSGSISQRHGSPDQDPHQNVMDPEHCLVGSSKYVWTPGAQLHTAAQCTQPVGPTTRCLFLSNLSLTFNDVSGTCGYLSAYFHILFLAFLDRIRSLASE